MFTLNETYKDLLFYSIAVNMEGEISVCRLLGRKCKYLVKAEASYEGVCKQSDTCSLVVILVHLIH